MANLKTKCLKALDILKVLSHTSWGADRKQLLRLYKALVLPKLTYGCEVFTSATSYRLKILNAIHNAGIRIATGAFKSSPIESMLVDACEIPLEFHFQTLLVRSWMRFQRLPDSLASEVIRKESFFNFYRDHPRMPQPFSFRVKQILCKLHIVPNDIMAFRYPAIAPWRLSEVKHCKCLTSGKKDIPEEVMHSAFLEHAMMHENAVPVYTDGSKSDAGVGFGIIFPDSERGGSLCAMASIFTAELFAILSVLKEILMRPEKDCYF